jgi:solute:Na+ symporter, SSS family
MSSMELVVVVAFFLVTAYLGFLGYRNTKSRADYIIAGRNAHPVVMALSYGSTFISTSAIVGFGGVAGMFGMGLMWLVFLNLAVGIFIAFVFFGDPIRHISHRLDAHTLPELLGRRYQSRFIQVFCGLVIFLFMPLYGTAVLLGGAEFVQILFRLENFNIALLILALVVALYVLAGGIKAVMYTDALQGGIMVIGMIVLLVLTYIRLDGVTSAHGHLTALAPLVPEKLKSIGHQGWTSMPLFGFGDVKYNLWWIMVSTITLGVGIGVLAQPQMAARFMTVKSKREINRGLAVGGVFILLLTGVPYTVGALSNVYFHENEVIVGTVQNREQIEPLLGTTPPEGTTILVWAEDGKKEMKVPMGKETEISWGGTGKQDIIHPRLISIARTGGQRDQIIPTFITTALPRWFGIVFLLTLLSAAMSTLSGLLHAMGTSAGRDIFEQLVPGYSPTDRQTVLVTRIGIIIGLIASLILAAKSLRGYIAVSTALFYGLCAVSFLPTFLGALFWKRMTRWGAIVSMVGGFTFSLTWMLFIFEQTAKPIGLCLMLTGKTVLWQSPNWPVVDPIVIGLPFSFLLAVVVSLCTRPPDQEVVDRCFG